MSGTFLLPFWLVLFSLVPDQRAAALGPAEARLLVEKMDYSRFGQLSGATDQAVEELIRMMRDTHLPSEQRYSAAIALGSTGSSLASDALFQATRDPDFNVRRCAAEALPKCSDDTEKIRRVLGELASRDPFSWRDPATGEVKYLVREAAQKVLASLGKEIRVDWRAVSAGALIPIVLVKDFMRLDNKGPDRADVEFKRYFIAIDSEQIVAGRLVDAKGEDGASIPISLARVEPDEEGNLIHTYRLSRFPAKQQVLVTVTSVVARREKPAPAGPFPIPKPEEYPAKVRPFLSSTEMVSRDHPEIQQQARDLLAKTRDALEIAARIAELMKGKSYTPVGQEGNLPTAVSTLRYGSSCCASAVCASALLRACGIPAQATYCPGGYIHGIIQFYLNGYGWVRMDSTCGTGRLPLIQSEEGCRLVRILDMPIQMEALWNAYAWPYHHNDERGEYQFRSRGEVIDGIQFASRPPPAPKDGSVQDPVFHYEPGTWSLVLGTERNEGAWQSWDALCGASRAATSEGQCGWYPKLVNALPCLKGYASRISEVWIAQPKKSP